LYRFIDPYFGHIVIANEYKYYIPIIRVIKLDRGVHEWQKSGSYKGDGDGEGITERMRAT
jgi:hypothetical protein